MFAFVTIVHIIICVILIMVVLLQTGKGAEMGAAFGGATQTVFGSSGPAGFLSKLTTAVAILFMITTLALCYFTGRLPLPTIMEQKVEPPVAQEAAPMSEEAAPPAPAPVQEQGEAVTGAMRQTSD